MLLYSWPFSLAATLASLVLGAGAKRSWIREGRVYCDSSNLRTWFRWILTWRWGFPWLVVQHLHFMSAAVGVRYFLFMLPLAALTCLDQLYKGVLGAQFTEAASLSAGFLSISTLGKVSVGAMVGLVLTPLVYGYIRSATGEEVLDAFDNAVDANQIIPRRRWMKWLIRLDTALCRRAMNELNKRCLVRNRDILESIPEDRFVDVIWEFAQNNREKLDEKYWYRLAVRDAPELARQLHAALKPSVIGTPNKAPLAEMTPLLMQLLVPILGFSGVEAQIRALVSPQAIPHPGPDHYAPPDRSLDDTESD